VRGDIERRRESEREGGSYVDSVEGCKRREVRTDIESRRVGETE